MLKVTIELISAKDGRHEILGEGIISLQDFNDSGTRGDYTFRLFGKKGYSFRKGKVINFPRKRLLAWDLLYRVLKEAIGNRNER